MQNWVIQTVFQNIFFKELWRNNMTGADQSEYLVYFITIPKLVLKQTEIIFYS
jgi:hypothetical protein